METDRFKGLLDEKGVKYWEYRKENLERTSVTSWNKSMNDMVSGTRSGYSFRVLYDNSWGFAYSEKDTKEDIKKTLIKALDTAKKLSGVQHKKTESESQKASTDRKKTKVRIDPKEISLQEKKELCLNTTKSLLNEEKVKSSRAIYHDFTKTSHFENSEGSDITQELIKTYFAVNVVSGEGNNLESAFERKGASQGFEVIDGVQDMKDKALKNSRMLLKAKVPKGGNFPVICDGSLTDVFIHEAVGHAAEADHVMNKDSCFEGKLGKDIGDEKVNVFDSPKGNLWGSYFYDEEGVEAKNTQIIKEGKLMTLLTSRENASALKVPLSGNGRAEDASSIPIVRMSNTHLQKGKNSFSDMIDEVKSGFYLVGSRGGQVNTKTGNFTFSAEYGYSIKDGELKEPLKGVSLSGNTLKILKSIEMISNKYETGSPGMCGKQGQSVPVIGNCPKIRINRALVGGR